MNDEMAPADKEMDEVTLPREKICVKIPAGTVVEIEVAFGIRSADVKWLIRLNFASSNR